MIQILRIQEEYQVHIIESKMALGLEVIVGNMKPSSLPVFYHWETTLDGALHLILAACLLEQTRPEMDMQHCLHALITHLPSAIVQRLLGEKQKHSEEMVHMVTWICLLNSIQLT
ncbi:MAG: hypothetical protein EBY83_06930 [Verrucomicrobia bacterium]|nr:hypothetical protein [Verrucomicrobiota bacterium]